MNHVTAQSLHHPALAGFGAFKNCLALLVRHSLRSFARIKLVSHYRNTSFVKLCEESPPNSALRRARDFGVDLTLLAARLRMTPEERLDSLQQAMDDLEAGRRAVRAVPTARRIHGDEA